MTNIKIGDKEFNKEQVKIILFTFILNVIFLLIMLFLKKDRSIIFGVASGFLVSLINYRLLYLSLRRALQMDEHSAKRFVTLQYLIRYFLIIVLIYGAFVNKNIDLISFIVSLFLLKIVLFIFYTSKGLNKKENKDEN